MKHWIRVVLCCMFMSGKIIAVEPVDADILLQGGTIFDGSGGQPYVGDVAISGDRLIAIGSFESGQFGRVIDCKGLSICPGFIDLHNHSDQTLLESCTRANTNFVLQGCTTIVTGNCGAGHVDVRKYLNQIETFGAGTNVIHLLPHGALRKQVLGTTDRPPTAKEMQQMKQLAGEAMEAGAWGMSTGLIYVPGAYASLEEIVEIARVIAAGNGIYASHIRNEAMELLDAVNEALQIGHMAQLPVHISHFKSSQPKAWGLVRNAAELIQKARDNGQLVTADQYPYIASSTSLEAMLIPTDARAGGRKKFLDRMKSREFSEKIRRHIHKTLEGRGTQAPIRIARYPARTDWLGLSIREIAKQQNQDTSDIVFQIIRKGGASVVSFGMQEEDVRFVMQLPWVATASDGRAYIPAGDKPHPRSYGTFPRKLGYYARQERVLSMASAIRSATQLPADILGLTSRGSLVSGNYADVVVFDSKQILDQATFIKPHQYSRGISFLFINGQLAVSDGIPTGALLGRALRPEDK